MRSRNDGYVIITVAILLVVLLGFSALAVDLGIMYSARTSAQRAADAAALAGAFTFVVDTASPQPGTATLHAQQTAVGNNILGEPITAGEVAVNVDVANRLVTVDVTRNESTFFGKVLGQSLATIHTRALAEASTTATAAYCVKPWFLTNTIASTQAPCTACGNAQTLISGGQVTAFAKSKFGLKFNIKPQVPSSAIAPGEFYALQLPGSVGGSDYRTNIGTCPLGAVACNQFMSVETGNKVGPTKQGVEDLVGKPPDDTYIGVGQYRHPDSSVSDTSKALVVAPIWDTCNLPGFCPANKFPNGTNVNLKIIGFAMVFLEGVQGNNVVARLINVSPCANGAPPPTETGPYGLPVRLVRPVS